MEVVEGGGVWQVDRQTKVTNFIFQEMRLQAMA